MTALDIWASEPDLDRLRSAYALQSSDPKRALAEFQALADIGSVMSLNYIAYIFEMGRGVPRDLANAEEYYQRAYDRGSVDGLFNLGKISWQRKDYKKAEEIFLIGASKNDPRATYWLAVLYLKHAGDRDRLEEAVALLRRASSMGHIQSTRRLGWILAKGHFGVLNILRGLRMYLGAGIAGARLAVKDPSNERLRDLPIQQE